MKFFLLPLVLFSVSCQPEPLDSTKNSEPVITNLYIHPDVATTSSVLQCIGTAIDSDKEKVSLGYRWMDSEGSILSETQELVLTPDIVQPNEMISCAMTASDQQTSVERLQEIQISNTSPIIDSIEITPSSDVEVNQNLVCTAAAVDEDNEIPDVVYQWKHNGVEHSTGAELFISPSQFDVGAVLRCISTARDSYEGVDEQGAEVVVSNTPPIIEVLSIEPSEPTSQDDLTCIPSDVTDINADAVAIEYGWTVDGAEQAESTNILEAPFPVGAQITCRAIPTDGENTGEAMTAAVDIINSVPVIDVMDISPSKAYADTTIQCSAAASDIDQESVELSYLWTSSRGVSLGNSAMLSLSPRIAFVGESIACTATATDINDAIAQLEMTVEVENTPPVMVEAAVIEASPAPITTGVLECSAEYMDIDDGPLSVSFEWRGEDNALLSSASTYIVSAEDTETGDILRCTASASDSQGASITSSVSITLENSLPMIHGLTLNPATVHSQDAVLCSVDVASDIDQDPITYLYSWMIDGASQSDSGNVLNGPFMVGTSITCLVTPSDGKETGSDVSINVSVTNTPPSIQNPSLSPALPYTEDSIVATALLEDQDSEQLLTASYEWWVVPSNNGSDTLVQSGPVNTLSGELFDRDEQVYVVVTANDGVENGLSQTSLPVMIQNTAPTAPEITLFPSVASSNDDLHCQIDVASFDLDGDALTYQFDWIDPSGNVIAGTAVNDSVSYSNPSEAGDWFCQVTVSDGSRMTSVFAQSTVYDDCDVSLTDWSTISTELLNIEELLPRIPTDLLTASWDEPIHDLIIHSITPADRNGYLNDVTSCVTPPFWDQDRVILGPFVDGVNPHCRIQLRDTNPNDPGLFALNRHRWSKNEPITGEPAWLQFRFPVPDDHVASRLRYEINWARLFGSEPTQCHPDDQDSNGDCFLAALDPGESWDDAVPGGLFILWGEAGTCGGWTISGPHEPIDNIEYSGTTNYTIEVPEEVQDVEELVVTFMVYHQYPGGCENSNCISGEDYPYNIAFHGVDLFTEKVFTPLFEPPTEHPRLFGDNETWMSEQEHFENMDCLGSNWPINSSWGGLTNVRNNWDLITKGGMACESEVPTSLYDVSFAEPYLNGTASWEITQAVKALHLVRRERACQSTGIGTCWFDPQEVEDLAAAIINVEMARLSTIVWNSFSFEFDLRTREPMRVYTLLADVLWDDLTIQQHQDLSDTMGVQIDGYLNHFNETHWAVFNGNNWTPVLAEGALYWAITYYHEDDRAPDVARLALYSLWLHRHSYLDDGVYNEGLLMYSQVSFDPLVQVSRLAESSFGLELQSPPWERMEDFSNWALAFMGTDGYTIDFGDSWAKKGWSTFMPLLAHMVDPLTGRFDKAPDPCFAYRFFNNKYYFYGVTDPWTVHTALSQDWPAILAACPTGNQPLSGMEIDTWDIGGWGSIRIGLPGSTSIGSQVTTGPSLYAQHDQVMLTTSAIPNSSSHTEMDFATMVWIAYGNRLLVDYGYGSIGSNRYETYPDYQTFDNNPTGHNTLVIPETYQGTDLSTNTSQIDGEVGTMSQFTLDGYTLISLDGSAVYGRDNVEYGWMEHFERLYLPFDDGTIFVIDSLQARSDRGLISPEEYWLTYTGSTSASTCSNTLSGTHKIYDTDNVTILPTCSTISKYDYAESAGRIVGTGIEGGSFVEMPDITLINRLNQVDSKSQFKWTPDQPQDSDIRVFALLSATSESALPVGTWQWNTCGNNDCATLSLDSIDYATVHFENDNGQYVLTAIDKW